MSKKSAINKITVSFKNNDEELYIYNVLDSLSDKSAVIKQLIKGEVTFDSVAKKNELRLEEETRSVHIENESKDQNSEFLTALATKMKEFEIENIRLKEEMESLKKVNMFKIEENADGKITAAPTELKIIEDKVEGTEKLSSIMADTLSQYMISDEIDYEEE